VAEPRGGEITVGPRKGTPRATAEAMAGAVEEALARRTGTGLCEGAPDPLEERAAALAAAERFAAVAPPGGPLGAARA